MKDIRFLDSSPVTSSCSKGKKILSCSDIILSKKIEYIYIYTHTISVIWRNNKPAAGLNRENPKLRGEGEEEDKQDTETCAETR